MISTIEAFDCVIGPKKHAFNVPNKSVGKKSQKMAGLRYGSLIFRLNH
jgi:hypothetical protein